MKLLRSESLNLLRAAAEIGTQEDPLSDRQLRFMIGSGKIYWGRGADGEMRIPNWEVKRLGELHGVTSDCYVIWVGDRVEYINSNYAALLTRQVGHPLEQWYICRLFQRGEIEGRKQGNTIKVKPESLEGWIVNNFNWGRPVELPILPPECPFAPPGARSYQKAPERSRQHTRGWSPGTGGQGASGPPSGCLSAPPTW